MIAAYWVLGIVGGGGLAALVWAVHDTFRVHTELIETLEELAVADENIGRALTLADAVGQTDIANTLRGTQ